jgi:hypothetical protein
VTPASVCSPRGSDTPKRSSAWSSSSRSRVDAEALEVGGQLEPRVPASAAW